MNDRAEELSVERMLRCAGLTLDSQVPEMSSGHPDENMAPHLRTTGLRIQLQMEYFNTDHPALRGDVMVVCAVTIRILTQWTWHDKKVQHYRWPGMIAYNMSQEIFGIGISVK